MNHSNPDENDHLSGAEYYAAYNDRLDVGIISLTNESENVPSVVFHSGGACENTKGSNSSSGVLDASSSEGTIMVVAQEYNSRTSPTPEGVQKWKTTVKEMYKKESLLIDVLAAILVAWIYPRMGAEFLFPEITAHWVAVIVIFYLSGFALKLEQLSDAASNWKFNFFVMGYNFIGISFVVTIVAHFFARNEIVSEDLMKGMIICSCLAMPSNLMLVLSISSNGDEAVALFLATLTNLIGVIITPLLVFLYLQENAEIDFVSTYKSISLRVLLPVSCGIITRLKIPGADDFATDNKQTFVKFREKCLVYVVYATFCTTFVVETDSTRAQIMVMALSQVILLTAAMVLAWILLFIFFNRHPKLRVVGLFGCSTKTIATGIPLISAIYEDSPRLGIYTLPLLIWYLSQLIIGTMLAPRLSRFVNYKMRKYEMEEEGRGSRSTWLDSKACNCMTGGESV